MEDLVTAAGGPELSTVSEGATSTRSSFSDFSSGRSRTCALRSYEVNSHSTIGPPGIHYLLVISVNYDSLFRHCDLMEVHHIIKMH
jgi:hypothetical protein